MKPGDKFFAASLFFRGERNGCRSDADLWEESIVLVLAEDEAEATRKAEEIGQNHACAYRTCSGDMLVWKFIQIERIQEIIDPSLTDGAEIFSRFLRNHEAKSLLTPFAAE
jgi:hypothetical protein